VVLVSAIEPSFAEALSTRHEIERELGRGGMATVYFARDLKHDRPVALKVLQPELAHALGPERGCVVMHDGRTAPRPGFRTRPLPLIPLIAHSSPAPRWADDSAPALPPIEAQAAEVI